MPAKSNKFDFTNRTSHGLKMGQIIGHALEKEADKVIKDAEKAQQKSQKQRNGSPPDTYTHTTHLDIRAPAKDLGDEGTFALIAGLENALVKGTDHVRLVLEDLNLAHNGITTASLVQLAPVIVLAEDTLKSLNLSHNVIQVESDEEADQWEQFLRAFDRCTALRRIDLTGNRQLGPKALEILAKLHTAADLVPPCRLAAPAEGTEDTNGRLDSHDSGSIDHSLDSVAQQDTVRFGLRSIPYLVFNDVGLNDSGALWLSFVVEDHFYPCQLHADGSHTRADATAAGDAGGNGIEYADNEDSLTRDGASVLKQAENLRRQLLEDDGGFDHLNGNSRATRGSNDEELLERGRKKLQRCTIMAEGGAGKVDIWRAALRVVATSRMFLYGIGVSPERRVLSRVDQSATQSDSTNISLDCEKLTLDENVRPGSTHEQQMSRGDSAIGEIPFLVHRKQPKTAKKLVAKRKSHQLNAETAIASAPMSPQAIEELSDHTRKDAFGAGSDVPPDPSTLRAPPTATDFLTYQRRRLDAASEHGASPLTRNLAVPSHLPAHLIARIAQQPFTPRERAALTTEQLADAVRWGCERASLRQELEWLKDHQAVQVLRLLESVGCLEYAREG